MTKAQAIGRIDILANEPSLAMRAEQVHDARRLVDLLPERALLALLEDWIRLEPIHADQIEFFWSRSADLMVAGNRITRLQTLGSGRFSVLTGEPDSIRWQRSPEGDYLPDVLAIDGDGLEALIKQLIEWQVD